MYTTDIMPNKKRTFASIGVICIRYTSVLVYITAIVSMVLFSMYICSFYVYAFINRDSIRWEAGLPGLYFPRSPIAEWSIWLHFIAGSIIMILGYIQLIPIIRIRFINFHRWIGRLYVILCGITAVGGVFFILLKGTIGGIIMNIGFLLYGILLLFCALKTYLTVKHKQFVVHRIWAIRLFSLVIGSWLYRMYYGFWFFSMDGLEHELDFTGWFDKIMVFFFYIPNLVVAEVFLRYDRIKAHPFLNFLFSFLFLFLFVIFLLGTYHFYKYYWSYYIKNEFFF